jgi:uncharacterized OB-fold protein
MAELLLPNTADRETHGFFEAAAAGKLVYRICNACHHGLHPPTGHCPRCGSWDTAWAEAKGTGKLHSWTTVTHQIHPGYPTPYTLVLVELDETPDVRLLGRIAGAPALRPGMPMRVWFEKLADGTALPQWRPA